MILFKYLCLRYSSKKMADCNSSPAHGPTISLWDIGDGCLPSRQLKIACWNVNGFRAVVRNSNLELYIEKFSPDMICLNQTKLDLKKYKKQGIIAFFHDLGYHQYWNFCKISSGYSGVMIASRHLPLKVIEDLPEQPMHSLQGRMLTIEYDSFYLATCYKPNSGLGLNRLDYRVNQYDQALKDYIVGLRKKKPVILAGDMNVAHKYIDIRRPQANLRNAGFTIEQRTSFQKFLEETQLVDSYRKINPKEVQYTWWSYQRQARKKNVGWRIDYVLTDPTIKIIDAEIHDQIMGSDHCPVSVKIQL